MIEVRIELTETSQSIIREAQNTYTKGAMFCVYTKDGLVEKYPLANIWRVTETYGT